TGSPLTVTATATGLEAEMLDLVDGDGQTGKANSVLLEPIRIKAWGYRNPIEGQTVYFDVSEGSVSPVSAVTDVSGLVSTTWTLGPTAGTQTLTVTSFEADGTTHLDDSPLLVNATAEAQNETGTVTDYDGNVYATVKIGEQWWMAENLKATSLPDGTAITNVTDDTEWKNLGVADKAYCYENNDVDSDYGIFYTRSAALNVETGSTTNPSGIQGVCPDGWHIPSDAEWRVLKNDNTTNVLKEPGTEHWLSPNESNNESGFTALGAGLRSSSGTFFDFQVRGYWWLTDIYTYNGNGMSFYIGGSGDIGISTNKFDTGISVRCVKD
ncbi:MAG: FISUMP domain-containing protein, partial [Bacteroidales bacterium]|nr:FISUMP domain-containing protein [Bacteroidales bacterium]